MGDSEQDDSQKTEDPTPKRLEEARKKGQVALSREINNWIMLLAATIMIGALLPGIMKKMEYKLAAWLEHAADVPDAPGAYTAVLKEAFGSVLGILALPLLILMFAAFIGPFIQIGPLFAPEIVKPDIGKVSPLRGFKRLFSMRAMMEFVKGLLKISVIAAVGFFLLSPFYGQVDHMVGMPPPLLLGDLKTLVIRLMIGILVALMIIAVIDILFQRTEHMKKMRMSRQELKDEYRQTEGDPHVRARLRQLRAERARRRMMQAVPEADVVITNPTHYAVALKYDPDNMDAPLCVAKGMDDIALRIREVAKANDVVLFENPPLARILFDTVEVDETIPPEHYKAVAEIISYVFRLKGKLK